MMLFSGMSFADTMIGARMGGDAGMVCCDFDVYKPGESGASAKRFMEMLEDSGLLPETQEHKTLSGGVHIIYKTEGPFPSSVPVDGVEIKGEGGYIIVPPSKGYEIVREGLTQAPPALLTLLRSRKKETQATTTDALKEQVLAGEAFHEPLTSIAAKLAAAGSTLPQVMKVLVELMQGSIAQVSSHARHDRWASLMADSGKELTRIATSANNKYNTAAVTERATEKVTDDIRERILKAAAGKFAPSPTEGNFEPPPKEAEIEYDEDEWPFADSGYFAHEERKIAEQTFVMYPLMAERETVLIAAEPKVGKSAIALTFAFHIAIGESIGSAFEVTKARPVLYFSLEGQRATELRLEAIKRWRRGKKLAVPESIPLFVIERSTDFAGAAQDKTVKQILAADKYSIKHAGVGLGAVFLDTLTKAMPGGDQNSVEDTSKLFDVINKLRDGGFMGTIIIIHHLSRQGNVRGSTNIEAEVDVICTVAKAKENKDEVLLRIARARSIDDGGVYGFKFENFALGTNSQGHRMAAPVVHLTDFTDSVGATPDIKHSMALGKLLKLVTEQGLGRHEVVDFMHLMVDAGMIPPFTHRRARKVPESVKGYLIATAGGQLNYVYKDFAVAVEKEGTEIVAFTVRKIEG